jgi:hypothetical protein
MDKFTIKNIRIEIGLRDYYSIICLIRINFQEGGMADPTAVKGNIPGASQG